MKYAEKPLLITTTLLDGFQWLEKCPGDWKERAFNGMVKVLNRTSEFNPTPEIKRGIDFENKMMMYANLKRPIFEHAFEAHTPKLPMIWDKIHGGIFQKKTTAKLVVEDQEYILWGKIDAQDDEKRINYDLKTKNASKYRGPKEYFDKSQHLLYAYCEKMPDFEYIIALMQDFGDSAKCVDVDFGTLLIDLEEAEQELKRRISSMVGFLALDPSLMEAYINVFTRY